MLGFRNSSVVFLLRILHTGKLPKNCWHKYVCSPIFLLLNMLDVWPRLYLFRTDQHTCWYDVVKSDKDPERWYQLLHAIFIPMQTWLCTTQSASGLLTQWVDFSGLLQPADLRPVLQNAGYWKPLNIQKFSFQESGVLCFFFFFP